MKTNLIIGIIIATSLSASAASITAGISLTSATNTGASTTSSSTNNSTSSATTNTNANINDEIPNHLDKATSVKICEDVKSKIDNKVDVLRDFTDNEQQRVHNVIDKLDKVKELASKKLNDQSITDEIQERKDTVSEKLDKFTDTEKVYTNKILEIKKLNCNTSLKDVRKKIEDSKSDHKDLVSNSEDLRDYISVEVKNTIEKVKVNVDKTKSIFDKIRSLISNQIDTTLTTDNNLV